MDGDLRGIFRRKVPRFFWTSIETGMTGRGIPDAHYCCVGVSGWAEFKVTNAFAVNLRPEQVAWLLRYDRCGGTCWIAVRRQVICGPRKGKGADELWLIRGSAAARLKASGLKKMIPADVAGIWGDGPGRWDWVAVEKALLKRSVC